MIDALDQSWIRPFWSKPLRGNVMVAVLLVFFGSINYTAVLAIFIVIVLVVWLPTLLYSIARRRDDVSLKVRQLIIWIACAAIIATVHWIRHIETRHEAEAIVAKIRNYSQSNKHWPASIEEVGISKLELQNRFPTAVYWNRDGKPEFIYGATYMIERFYIYDFETNQWKFVDG